MIRVMIETNNPNPYLFNLLGGFGIFIYCFIKKVRKFQQC